MPRSSIRFFHRTLSRRPIPPTKVYTRASPPSPLALPGTDKISPGLRDVMRKLPYPVIVTSAYPQTSTPLGITLSSFNSFSMSPPLISFNIRTPSAAGRAMTASGVFTVHVLRSTPHAARLASLFARPWAVESAWEGVRGGAKEKGMLGVEDDVLYRLRCETKSIVQVEDHQVWVGRVRGVDVLAEGGEKAGVLVYAEGAFRNLVSENEPGDSGG